MLTKEQIKAADDLARETVDVPEWGGSVCVRSMTGAERLSFERKAAAKDSPTMVLLIAMTTCDEAGALIFTEADVDDLAGKSVQALHRVYKAAMRLNKVTPDDVEASAKKLTDHPLRGIAFRLAERAGILDVDAMLRAIPGPLLTEWMGYYLSPASLTTTDRLLSQLCAMTFNANRDKNAPARSPEDFLPRPPRSGTIEERRRAARLKNRRGVEVQLRGWATMSSRG